MITLPRILLIAAFLVAGAGYMTMGSPGLPDQPMAQRDAELSQRNPSELSESEMLARLERMTQTRPDDPEPHYFIGRFLMSQGREPDAVRAFQSSLRRDIEFVPALVGLADAFVRLSNGEVGPEAQRLYADAYTKDRTHLHAAFRIGLAYWQAGNTDDAISAWTAVSARIPEGAPEAAMWQGWVDTALANPPSGKENAPIEGPSP